VGQANVTASHSKLPGLCQHEMVSGFLRNESNVGLCKPVVGAWKVMCAWASVSQILPHNSTTLKLRVLMSMQMMDVEFKKQTGTLFVWVGAL
jgi:hypothetical protein